MARGLVTADGFVAVRAMDRPSSRGRRRTRTRGTRSSGTENDVGATHLRGGRWTSFPGPIPLAGEGERAERWARQLLDRYGMMCRDLLSRETAAPAWTDLVRVLRRLEARGEIRGGRFVTDLAGEQFATAAALERLRSLRDERPGEEWVVISGVDPLNLTGILDSGERVPAISGATLLLVDGHVVARRHAGTATVSADVDPITAERMSTALELGPCFRSYLSDTAAIASGRPRRSQERSQEWGRERPRSRMRSRGGPGVHRRGS